MKAVESLEKEERRIRLVFMLILLALILSKYATQFAFGERIAAIYSNKAFEQLANEIVIACEISIILFIVEGRIRKSHLKQVELNVLQATLSISVPDELARELAMIIKEPIYREDLRYHLTFLPPDGSLQKPDDLFILRMELRYTVRNITDIRQRYEIGGTFDDRHDTFLLSESSVRNAIVVKINDRQINFVTADVTKQNLPPGSPPSGRSGSLLSLIQLWLLHGGPKRSTSLYVNRRKRSFWFAKKISVPGSGRVDVCIKTDEVLPLSVRRNVYVQLRPSVNLFLTISNGYRSRIRDPIGADLNHRAGTFTKDSDSSYRYEGGILPGQSFDVSWELTDDEPSPGDKASQEAVGASQAAPIVEGENLKEHEGSQRKRRLVSAGP